MAMIVLVLTTLLVIFLISFFKIAYDTLSCYFLTPRRIKKIMEKQGVRGPKPRPLIGNILDVADFVSQSTAKDMDHITHDTVNRLLPHYVAWSKQYGMHICLTFETGLKPETELFKELCWVSLFSKKRFDFSFFREKVYILEWGGAKAVHNRD
jgi:cytokinin trans-hydroxylase